MARARVTIDPSAVKRWAQQSPELARHMGEVAADAVRSSRGRCESDRIRPTIDAEYFPDGEDGGDGTPTAVVHAGGQAPADPAFFAALIETETGSGRTPPRPFLRPGTEAAVRRAGGSMHSTRS